MRIAFFGLGNMGAPMALNLLRAGHQMVIFNRTAEKAAPLIEAGATLARTPVDAVENCDVAITMLANDSAVRDTILANTSGQAAVIDRLPRGAVHMCTSTISVALSRELTEAHLRHGQNYVAATVLGRPEAAEQKKLWVMAAGPHDQIERCRPLMDAIGRGVSVMGEQPWQANLTKIASNFMLASVLETMGEAFALVRKSGMDPHAFLDVVNSLFASPVYANYGRIIADRQFKPAGFRLKLGLKDIGLAIEAGQEVSVPLPLASLVRDHYLTAIARGRENEDWAAVAEVAAENADLVNRVG